MVERRVTDGKRIGQLLASELTGLQTGVLADVSVVDADPDATPSEAGTEAYRVTHDGAAVASVLLYPEHVTVCLQGEHVWPDRLGVGETPAVERQGGDSLRVLDGAGVKRAVDAVRDLLGPAKGR
jgi:hypothetical protein